MIAQSIRAQRATEPSEPDLLVRVASVMNGAPQYEGCGYLAWRRSVDVRGYSVSAIRSVQNHLEELGYVVWYECCPCQSSTHDTVSWTPSTTRPRMVIDWGSWRNEVEEATRFLLSGSIKTYAGLPETVTRTIASVLRERGFSVRVEDGLLCIESHPVPQGMAAA